jgi:CheY-like chemotaxis protein
VANSIRPEAELKNIAIRIVRTRLWGLAPPELLERVLVNLAANAVRYTPAGAILMGVRRRRSSAELWVTDTGIGIAKDDREKIFQEFYQVGNPARHREQGYGLGLAIVRRLCDGMGWPIEYQSNIGRGTTFKVSIPIALPTLDEAAGEMTVAPTPIAGPTLGVVIVDDDPLVSDAMKRLIESWGVHVETCRCGDAVLEILGDRDITLQWHALVDYRLSGDENGLIVADRIRATFGNSVGITLITAETDSTIFQQTNLRNIATLRKPIKPIRLRAILTAPVAGRVSEVLPGDNNK